MLKSISQSLVKKLNITFPILCDVGNKTAKDFGLVFTIAESLKPIYTGFGIDLQKSNGDNSQQLPIPATYILGTDHQVKFSYIDVDHTTRLDPETLMKKLEIFEEK